MTTPGEPVRFRPCCRHAWWDGACRRCARSGATDRHTILNASRENVVILRAVRVLLLLAPAVIALEVSTAFAESGNVAGLVDIGSGQKMYLECSGTGSPTVVLISGKGNGAADWSEVLDPADPEHHADCDAMAWGKGNLHKSNSAVFPMVSRFSRVCAYDRPGTRLSRQRCHSRGRRRCTEQRQAHCALGDALMSRPSCDSARMSALCQKKTSR